MHVHIYSSFWAISQAVNIYFPQSREISWLESLTPVAFLTPLIGLDYLPFMHVSPHNFWTNNDMHELEEN